MLNNEAKIHPKIRTAFEKNRRCDFTKYDLFSEYQYPSRFNITRIAVL